MSSEFTETVPRAVVEENFRRMANPDERYTAHELYADDLEVSLPGRPDGGFDSAEDVVAYFDAQYEWCRKHFDEWYVDGNTVTTIGRLYGVDNNGDEFEDVRFVDIHTVEDGKITRKIVWNDLCEAGIVDYDAL